MKNLQKDSEKEGVELIQKNKTLYLEICSKGNIGSEGQAAELLRKRGYDRYVSAQSIKNRFRSENTRTDFFWHLLDATDCCLEVVKKGEPTRAELFIEIETLKNEQDMFSNIHPQVELQKKYTTLSQAFEKIQKTLKSLEAIDKEEA